MDGVGRLDHLGAEAPEVGERGCDVLAQLAGGLTTAIGRQVRPEHGVKDVARQMERQVLLEHRDRAELTRSPGLLELLERGVGAFDVGRVVLGVVQLHDLAADVRLEGAVVVIEFRKRVGLHERTPTRKRQTLPMSIYDAPVQALTGEPATLADYKGKALLIVNVASQCGLTPQYAGLQQLHETYGPRGFEVLGFPCNQFGGQEPGTADNIKTFCETNYSVDFPMFAKIEVNGDDRHPLYEQLTEVPDDEGKAGDVVWNFEKFLVSPDGEVVGRFRPLVAPEDPALAEAIESNLPS